MSTYLVESKYGEQSGDFHVLLNITEVCWILGNLLALEDLLNPISCFSYPFLTFIAITVQTLTKESIFLFYFISFFLNLFLILVMMGFSISCSYGYASCTVTFNSRSNESITKRSGIWKSLYFFVLFYFRSWASMIVLTLS